MNLVEVWLTLSLLPYFWGTFDSSYPFLLLPAKGMVCDDDNSANQIPIHKLKCETIAYLFIEQPFMHMHRGSNVLLGRNTPPNKEASITYTTNK